MPIGSDAYTYRSGIVAMLGSMSKPKRGVAARTMCVPISHQIRWFLGDSSGEGTSFTLVSLAKVRGPRSQSIRQPCRIADGYALGFGTSLSFLPGSPPHERTGGDDDCGRNQEHTTDDFERPY